MATPSTVATYELDNSQRDFDVTFDYLSQTFVQVSLIGETAQILALGSDYTFLSPTIIRTTLTYGPPDWAYIEVRRVTSTTERLVEFNDASILQASDLNLSDIQVLHVAEEARNAATETLGVNNDGNLDARGRRLVNVADPVDLGDAVNIRWYQEQVDGTHADAVIAAAARVAAEAAAAAALVSQTSASSSASTASAAAVSATASESAALSYRDSALTYRNEAQGFRNEAETFKNSAASSASAAYASELAAAASAASINPADLVHISGTESITGAKTFTVSPIVPAGATAGAAVNKSQLDAAVLDAAKAKTVGIKATPSGTAVTFSSADGTEPPSWATELTLHFVGVSAAGANPVFFQIGNVTVQAAGYVSGSTFAQSGQAIGGTSSTTSFALAGQSSANTYTGSITLTNTSGNTWVVSGAGSFENSGATWTIGGRVTLSGPLNILRVGASDGFDAGSVTLKARG